MSTPVPITVNVSASLSRVELADHDILLRLKNIEDSTVERKTANDYRDCLKTAVAFSNSLPVDDPGIIFVGVGNDGRSKTTKTSIRCKGRSARNSAKSIRRSTRR